MTSIIDVNVVGRMTLMLDVQAAGLLCVQVRRLASPSLTHAGLSRTVLV